MGNKSSPGRPLLGAHMSIAGGVGESVGRGKSIGCDCIQIFTKSSRQWKSKPYTEEEIAAFKRNLRESDIGCVIAHDSYLINLGAPDEELRKKSVAGFIDEFERCEALGVPWLVAHPGSHVGSGEEAGISTIASRSVPVAGSATATLALIRFIDQVRLHGFLVPLTVMPVCAVAFGAV